MQGLVSDAGLVFDASQVFEAISWVLGLWVLESLGPVGPRVLALHRNAEAREPNRGSSVIFFF